MRNSRIRNVLLCAATACCCCLALQPLYPLPTRQSRPHCSTTPTPSRVNQQQDTYTPSTVKRNLGSFILSTLLGLSTLASPWTVDVSFAISNQANPLQSSSPLVRLVKSQANALTEAQLLVDDVWRQVTRQYVDPTFNGQGEEGWRQKRQQALKEVAQIAPDEKQDLYRAIRTMLSTLGDPYTRFLTPEQYTTLTSYATGTVTGGGGGGIGVQLLGEPRTGKVVVVHTVPQGPADKAGILPGDLFESIDGQALTDDDADGTTSAEFVAAKCRGDIGSTVEIALSRPQGDDNQNNIKSVKVSVTRAAVQTNPVQAFTLQSANGQTIGVLTIPSMSQQTASQVMEALDQKLSSVHAVVLDLRGNVGGYMPAGVDVAKLFLQPRARVISEVDNTGRSTIYINDGVGSRTEQSLYILVDERTASAAEILAAALQDNQRATVVGSVPHTFGKGRIQNVQAMMDGSGLAVTKAKYVTPSGKDIQGVGIRPDVSVPTCGRTDSAAACLQGVV